MKFHPFADIFPLIEGDDFTALVADIKAHGLREKVVTYRGQILDGRNRFLACKQARVKPLFRAFSGDDAAALALVVSSNVHRRHLSSAQRAMAAAEVAQLSRGRPAENTARAVITQDEAAEKFDVSADSIGRARKVLDKGSKALQQAVKADEIPLKKAAAVVDLPKSEQLAAAKAKPEKPVAPALPPEAAADWEPDIDEDARIAEIEKQLADSLDKAMAADDKLAAAVAEIKRQAAEIAVLKQSRDGYMNGKAAITKLLRAEQRKADRLTRDLAKAQAEIEKLRERIAIMEST